MSCIGAPNFFHTAIGNVVTGNGTSTARCDFGTANITGGFTVANPNGRPARVAPATALE